MRKIELHDMMFHSFHGVSEEERKTGGEYIVSVTMEVDFSAAEESDQLDDTLDYEGVYNVVREEMEIPSKLIEHVAGRIIKRLRKEFSKIQTIEIRLTKLNPPVEEMTGSASVILKQ